MKLIDRLTRPRSEARFSLQEWADSFTYNGHNFPLYGYPSATGGGERIEGNFEGYVRGALKSNGIVYACMTARMLLFSEIEFKWQNLADRKLFGNGALSLLEEPAAGRTIGEVLAAMDVDASLAGNSFWTRRYYGDGSPFMRRLRPDWVEILSSGDANDLDSEVVAYAYTPGGPSTGKDPVFLDPAEVAHYSPIPDPSCHHRGMSWLTPILAEIEADTGFTTHRRKFIDNAAIIPYAISYPEMSKERFDQVVASYKKHHEGAGNSWSAFHLAGGADVKPLGLDLRALDFKNVQGGGETRICAAARVPAIVAQISEALGGSSLNSGNYSMARRQFGDGFAHPHWRIASGCLAKLVTAPAGSRLWYDSSQVSFLREDQKDAAEVLASQSAAMRQLVDGGFTAESVVTAVTSGDLTLLEHSNLVSVQLLPPGAQAPATTNGDAPSGDVVATN